MPDLASDCYFRDDSVGSGFHALLIGVSNYPFIQRTGLADLDGSALSAIQFANWLIAVNAAKDQELRLSFPLKSVRVLASPLDDETKSEPDLKKVKPALLDNVGQAARDWQADAAESPGGATLFYFAGHGIQRTRAESVLLLQDFLDPAGGTDLARTIGVSNVYNGMANFKSRPKLAKTQLFFIDACRSDLDALHLGDFETQEPTPLFKVESGVIDDRTAPIFFAAAPGKNSFNQKGKGTLFWQDLRACLDGMGSEQLSMDDGSDKWLVTVSKLNDSMCKLVKQFNQDHGFELRSCNLDKFDPAFLTTSIRSLKQAPTVPCRIDLSPPDTVGRVRVKFDLPTANSPATLPFDGPANTFQRPAGYYSLSAEVNPPYVGQYRNCPPVLKPVMPPFFSYGLRFR